MKLKNAVLYPALTALAAVVLTLAPSPAPRAAEVKADDDEPPAATQKADTIVHIFANSGSLGMSVLGGTPSYSTSGCLLRSAGWDMFFIPKRTNSAGAVGYVDFHGPNTPPDQFCATNENKQRYLYITTCTNANGMTLQTGIKVKNALYNTVVGCTTNQAPCSYSSKLSTLRVDLGTATDSYYRVLVHTKKGTTNGLSHVHINYQYADQ